VNYRLLQEWEVPDWIKTKPEDPDKFIQEFGAGKRQRKQVNYNEEFSEGQWLKIIEQGGDPAQEAEKIRKRRMEGGLPDEDGDSNKRRKLDYYQDPLSSLDGVDDSQSEEDEDFNAPKIQGKKGVNKEESQDPTSIKISIPANILKARSLAQQDGGMEQSDDFGDEDDLVQSEDGNMAE
jgi:Snf2-ATP coupling, chromatin remodelling complex